MSAIAFDRSTLKSKRRSLKGAHSRVLPARPPSNRGVSFEFEFCRHGDLKRMPSERAENETRYRWARGRAYSTRSVVFFRVTSPSGDYDSRHELSGSPAPLMCPQSPPGDALTYLLSFTFGVAKPCIMRMDGGPQSSQEFQRLRPMPPTLFFPDCRQLQHHV